MIWVTWLYPFFLLVRNVTDHLLGVRRPDFRRLFLATCKGGQCPELDRAGVKASPCLNEIGEEEKGYWLPMWTWPLVQILFTVSHRKEVAAGRSKPLESGLRPKDGDAGMFATAMSLLSMIAELKKESAPTVKGENKLDQAPS